MELLEQLHDTRTSNDALFSTDSILKDYGTPSVPPVPSNNREKAFTIGTPTREAAEAPHACPCVHTMRLPIHERITPAEGIDALKVQFLNNFQVSGHHNAFVYRDKRDCVFYMLLSTHSETRIPQGLGLTDEGGPLMGLSGLREPLVQSHKRSFYSSSFSVAGTTEIDHSILIKVHGVETPSEEITAELHGFLLKSLEERTLSTLSQLLVRNPQLKLTTQDLDFIKPVGAAPLHIFKIKIPEEVVEPVVFIRHLHRNMLNFMNVIHTMRYHDEQEDLNPREHSIGEQPNPNPNPNPNWRISTLENTL